MSTNYAKSLPRDTGGSPMQEYNLPYVALKVDSSENNIVSSVITFNDNTTTVEVAAVGAAAAIKWIATTNTNPSVITAAGTANFDHVIPPNTVRRFVIPQESIGVTSIVGINKQAGLYNRVAVKSVQIGSVMTTQY